MGEVRSNLAAGIRAADLVAHDAGLGEKDLHAALTLVIVGRNGRRDLVFPPALEILFALRNHEQTHMGMLKTAIFRTLSAIHARTIRLNLN
jgi:hypothetical protein